MKPELNEILKYKSEYDIIPVKHTNYPIYGVQFHPESIMTECGKKILNNFLKGE